MTGGVIAEYRPEQSLAILRLDNSARRNAISTSMWQRIERFTREMRGRPDVRAVLIRGTDGLFSAGADISDFEAARSGASNATSYDDLVEETCRAVEAIPQPTIAFVEGLCFGAGASLAASCDLRIATTDAQFAVPAARLGLGYDLRGIERFLRIFGPSTLDLLLTAERLPAERAYTLGAVHRLVTSNEAEDTALALAGRIAGNAPLTVQAAKLAVRAIRAGNPALRADALALAAKADASADYAEGRAAFAQKRKPNFKGA